MLLELLSDIIHLSHIRMDDGVDQAFSEELSFHWWHLVANEIVVAATQQLECFSHVVALLDVRGTIHEVAFGLCDHVELVVESVVTDVVAEGCYEE